ncbi:NAD(P)H-binding protein [Limnobacter sp.]|uniref:NAD(P)H-binding protein n=1 Tax=Limnobacter sp. TaxID=2003368 RepID=UPI00374782BF
MSSTNIQKTLLLVGATGVVGHSVLAQALAHPNVGKVVALTRKPITPHPKLLNQVIDFNAIPEEAPWWQADAVICTLGTTIKAAKTAEQFRFVDYTLVAQFAALAAQHAVPCFVLNSAMMANPKAKGLYLRTKGEAEQAVRNADIPSVVIARPGLLNGQREEFRLGEEIGLIASRMLNPLLPKRLRSVKVDMLARTMLIEALNAEPGTKVLESEIFQSGTV